MQERLFALRHSCTTLSSSATRLHMQNVGAKPCTLRPTVPANSGLSADSLPQQIKLAPGMSHTFSVTYMPDCESEAQQGSLGDIALRTASGTLKVPVMLIPQSARFELMDAVNFCKVAAGAPASTLFRICNTGKAAGAWTATVQGDTPVRVQPAGGELQPGETQTLTASMTEAELGSIAAELLVMGSDGTQHVKAPITGTVLKAAVEVLSASGQGATQVSRQMACQ